MRTRAKAGLVAAAFVGISALGVIPSFAADWPQYRGLDRNGISKEAGWLSTWPKEGPPILWKRGMGCGFSSVAVVGNRLYTEGTVGEKTRVWCLDAATGDELWHYDYELPVISRGKRLYSFPGPTSTPTVEGNNVYVYSRGGQLFCFDAATGKVAWQVENKIKTDAYGLACSPLILGGQVVVVAGGSNNLVVAFDKQSGKKLWSGGHDRAAYASPVVFQHKTGPALAVLGQSRIELLSAKDGKVMFSHPWPEHRNTADLIVSGDKLLAVCGATGGGKASALFKIPDAPGGALTEITRIDTLMQLSTPALWQGGLFGSHGNWGRLPKYIDVFTYGCIDIETGKKKWGVPGISGGATMIADGKLLILTIKGELIVAEASTEKWNPISRAKVVEGWCYSPPVLANGRIYCRNSGDDNTEGTMNKLPGDLKGGWLVCVDVSGKAKPGAEPKIHPRVVPQDTEPQAAKGAH
jgi:outer membrane protein assembly factor BamB